MVFFGLDVDRSLIVFGSQQKGIKEDGSRMSDNSNVISIQACQVRIQEDQLRLVTENKEICFNSGCAV